MTTEEKRTDDGQKAAAVQGGSRVASITSEGQSMNDLLPDKVQVLMVPKSKGHTGQVWAQHYDPDKPRDGGYMHPYPDSRPAAVSHDRGTDMDSRQSQYGTSPLRHARYDDVSRNLEDISEHSGERTSGSGAQARLPDVSETTPGEPDDPPKATD